MTRKRRWSWLLCLLSGCSTHPITDICDFFKPGKMYPDEVTPYGGVWVQQHPITPLTPTLPAIVPAAAPLGAVPAPVPLPGPPAAGFQLQPPLPPNPPRNPNAF